LGHEGALKCLRECVNLIVVPAGGEGKNLFLELVEPRSACGEVDTSRFDRRRLSGHPHDLVGFGIDADCVNVVTLQILDCSPSAPMRQIEGLSEGRISGSS
jgi:hypothetical protein